MAYHSIDVQVGTRLRQGRTVWTTAILILGLLANFREAVPAPMQTSADVSLEGEWHYSYIGYSGANSARYTGTVIVDAQGVANLIGTRSGKDPESVAVFQMGHVRIALPTAEFWFIEATTSDGKPYDLAQLE